MTALLFHIAFEQPIRVTRADSSVSYSMTVRLRSDPVDGKVAPPLYVIRLAAQSDERSLELPEMAWPANTPLSSLDLALGYLALFLRTKELDGWQIHPTIDEMANAANRHAIANSALPETLAGSVILGRLGVLAPPTDAEG